MIIEVNSFFFNPFCKVFGPKSQQRSIYDQAIAPIVNEVLDGFNCTVFAYGQTGTGKTYTMEGGMRNKVYIRCLTLPTFPSTHYCNIYLLITDSVLNNTGW